MRMRVPRTLLTAALPGLVLVLLVGSGIAHAGDPTGSSTGTAADLAAQHPGQPTGAEIAAELGHTKIALNYVWVLMAGFLVMFMQAGFAMLEVGFVRSKNAVHTMLMNLVIYGLGVVGFVLVGFGIAFGGAGPLASLGGGVGLGSEFTVSLFGREFGLFGMSGFGLAGQNYDVAVFALFLFQVVFMDAMATIPTGAMAERWRFANFCLYGLAVSMFVYPLFANWVWGGGWLSRLGANFGLGNGYVDFAGSSVVHAVGGLTALVGAWLLGPRIGKFGPDKTPRAIPGHNIPFAVVGAYILAFGWFGFNAGSTLAGGDVRLAVVAVNTMLASAAGMLAALLFMLRLNGKFDAPMSANGFLAGLVAITAPCAFVPAWAALVIGTIAGVLVCVVVLFVERVLHVDDPVGAVAVHGANGIWGCLAVGIFADGTYGAGLNGVDHAVRGLLYGGGDQFLAQLAGVLTCAIYAPAAAFVTFKVLNAITPMRSAVADEEGGLDLCETGTAAYEDSLIPTPAGVATAPGPSPSAADTLAESPVVVPAPAYSVAASTGISHVSAVIRPSELDRVKVALEKIGVVGLTVSDVRGRGKQGGIREQYRGTEYVVSLLPKVRVDVMVPDSKVDDVVRAVVESSRTGEVGDGKVFVAPLREAVRVRTGDHGVAAL
jgi:Amt family ammonium transporter